MKLKQQNENLELEEGIPLPFSSEYVVDYFDKIEDELEKQSKIRGRISKERRGYINSLIDDCEKLRKKVSPASNYKKVYNRI